MDVNIAFLQLLPGKTQEENLEKGLQACRKVFSVKLLNSSTRVLTQKQRYHTQKSSIHSVSYRCFFNFLSFFQSHTDVSCLFWNN